MLSFDVSIKDTLNLQAILDVCDGDIGKIGGEEVWIGHPTGIPHPAIHPENFPGSASEDMADISKKMFFGCTVKFRFNGKTRDMHVPAREYLTDGIEANLPDIKNQVAEYYASVVDGQPKELGLEAIAKLCRDSVVKHVYSGAYKDTIPNGRDTITVKSRGKNAKSDTPLLDTGLLVNTLQGIVKRKAF